MNHDHYDDSYLRRILTETRTIAVIGASPNAARASNSVLGYLTAAGYETYPINPGIAGRELFGRMVYARLAEVPVAVDMVDVFRNADAVGGVVDEILALPVLPRVVWLQLGVRNDAEAARLEARGVHVVMDRCPAIERPRLIG